MLGWWTATERQRFRQMANSVEAAVDIRSRHQGRRHSPPKKRMTPKDASWFVRRVAARWLAHMLDDASADGTATGPEPPITDSAA